MRRPKRGPEELAAMAGAKATVTLEVQVEIPSGTSDHVVQTVTGNGRQLKVTSQDFEQGW